MYKVADFCRVGHIAIAIYTVMLQSICIVMSHTVKSILGAVFLVAAPLIYCKFDFDS